MRRNGSRRDVRASGVELLQSSCFVLSGVRGTLLEKEYQYGHRLKRGAHPGNTGLRPLRGYELKCVYAVYRGGGQVKEFDRFPLNHTRDDFVSLSLCFTHCFVVIFFFTTEREREREADTNFRIKIFETLLFRVYF